MPSEQGNLRKEEAATGTIGVKMGSGTGDGAICCTRDGAMVSHLLDFLGPCSAKKIPHSAAVLVTTGSHSRPVSEQKGDTDF